MLESNGGVQNLLASPPLLKEAGNPVFGALVVRVPPSIVSSTGRAGQGERGKDAVQAREAFIVRATHKRTATKFRARQR